MAEEKLRARCEAHGLTYDPSVHSGCVVCRRGTDEGSLAPPASSKLAKWFLFGTLGLGVIAVVAIGVSVWNWYQERLRVEADEPSEPQVEQVVATLPGLPRHRGTVMLGRTGNDRFGYPRDLPDKLTLLSLLREERFEELTSHMESLQDAFEEDFRKEDWPAIAIEAFGTADPALGSLIDRWVKATPDSFAPYAARAEYAISRAWHYRGGKWARLTSQARFRKMGETLATAPNDLDRALALRPKLVEAHRMRIVVAFATSADLTTKRAILQDGLRHCPFCVGIRWSYLLAVSPRWGGSWNLVDKEAKAAQFPKQNPKLRLLLGFVDADRCKLMYEEKPKAALRLCVRALEHGDYAGYLRTTAKVLRKLDRHEEALNLLGRSLERTPQSTRSLIDRGHLLRVLNREEEAAEDFLLAARLDPVDEYTQKQLRNTLRAMVYEAYQAEKRGLREEAIATYSRAIEVHPNYADAWYYRAGANAKAGRTRLAESDLEHLIAIEPTHLEAHRLLDHILFKQKRLDEIVEHWNGYLARKPKDADALLERSGTYYHLGKLDLAKHDLAASCKLGNVKACQTQRRFK